MHTTTTWEQSTEGTSCVDTTTAERKVESTYTIFCSKWAPPMLYKNFHPAPMYKSLKQFRLQLAQQLIGDYCSRGRTGGAIAPLPLQHFPLKISDDSDLLKKRGRCANHNHKRTDSTQMILIHQRRGAAVRTTITLNLVQCYGGRESHCI